MLLLSGALLRVCAVCVRPVVCVVARRQCLGSHVCGWCVPLCLLCAVRVFVVRGARCACACSLLVRARVWVCARVRECECVRVCAIEQCVSYELELDKSPSRITYRVRKKAFPYHEYALVAGRWSQVLVQCWCWAAMLLHM